MKSLQPEKGEQNTLISPEDGTCYGRTMLSTVLRITGEEQRKKGEEERTH